VTAPSAEELRAMFKYDPDSGALTFRKGARAGKNVGWIDTLGYRRVWVNNKKYSCSKIAWAMMTGAFPECRLFTRDKNKLNLEWHNLVLSHPGMGKNMLHSSLEPLKIIIEPRINVTAALMGDPPPGRSMLDGYEHGGNYNASRSEGKHK